MNDQRYALVLLLSLITGSNPQPQFGPICAPNQQLANTVVYEGNSSLFFNQIDPKNVKWEIAPSFSSSSDYTDPPYTIADDNSIMKSSLAVSYAVTPTQLKIVRASVYPQGHNPHSTSGLYVVTYKTTGCQSMALLIVIAKKPTCRCESKDSDNAELSCELMYGVGRIKPSYPSMTWYDEFRKRFYIETPTPNLDNENYEVSTSYYSIKSSGAASYTCKVTFSEPELFGPLNLATNAPNFTASCTVANCVKKKAGK